MKDLFILAEAWLCQWCAEICTRLAFWFIKRSTRGLDKAISLQIDEMYRKSKYTRPPV